MRSETNAPGRQEDQFPSVAFVDGRVVDTYERRAARLVVVIATGMSMTGLAASDVATLTVASASEPFNEIPSARDIRTECIF